MRKILMLIVCLGIARLGHAQTEPKVVWSYKFQKVSPTEVVLYFTAEIQPDWQLYSGHCRNGAPMGISFRFIPSKKFSLVGGVQEPPPMVRYETSLGMLVAFFEDRAVFRQKIKVEDKAGLCVKGGLRFMAYNGEHYTPPAEVVFEIPII